MVLVVVRVLLSEGLVEVLVMMFIWKGFLVVCRVLV